MHIQYPKWLYHKTEKAVIVQDEAEHKALGGGWVEVPFPVDLEKEAEAVEKHGEAEEIVEDEKPEKTYREHMAEFESKADKAAKLKNRDAKITEKHRHSKKQKEAQ